MHKENGDEIYALEGFYGSACWNLVSPPYRSGLLTCHAYAIIHLLVAFISAILFTLKYKPSSCTPIYILYKKIKTIYNLE